jgi:hypothetical protein
MPAYWFMYNMYALARNAGKYIDRDKRTDKIQTIEYDYLAPDSINEIFDALELLKKFTGRAFAKQSPKKLSEKETYQVGEKLLEEKNELVNDLEIFADGFENGQRKTQLVKSLQAYGIFKELINYYGISQILDFVKNHSIDSWESFWQSLPFRARRSQWINIGGQLLPKNSVNTLIKKIHTGEIKSWDGVHDFYQVNGRLYKEQKFQHAFASLLEINKLTPQQFDKKSFKILLEQSLATREWMTKAIYESRSKDYYSEFRKMVYDTQKQMDKVMGKLGDNSFINQQKAELKEFKTQVNSLMKVFKLK